MTHLVEPRGLPEPGIIPLSRWEDIWTSFSWDGSGVTRPHTSGQLEPGSLPSPLSWQCHGREEVSCHRGTSHTPALSFSMAGTHGDERSVGLRRKNPARLPSGEGVWAESHHLPQSSPSCVGGVLITPGLSACSICLWTSQQWLPLGSGKFQR